MQNIVPVAEEEKKESEVAYTLKMGGSLKSAGASSSDKTVPKDMQQNALLYAYLEILTSVHVSLESSQTSANELNACEKNMSAANNIQNNISFIQIDQDGLIHQNGAYAILVVNGSLKWVHSAGGGNIATSQLPAHFLTNLELGSPYKQLQGPGFNMDIYVVNGLDYKPAAQDFDIIQEKDQEIEKERDFFSNKIIIYQQTSQVQQTNIGSKNDFMGQFIQEDTNIATILSTLASELAQMLRSP